MPRRKKEAGKKTARPKKEIKKPKKNFIKVRWKEGEANEEHLASVRETQAENFQNEIDNFEKVERSKRLVMWSGVTFFMLAIVVIWFINIRSVFRVSSSKSDFDFNKITEDVGKSMEEAKKGFEEIKRISELASTSPSTIKKDEADASSTAGILPDSSMASSSPEGSESVDLEELRKKIDDLEKELEAVGANQ